MERGAQMDEFTRLLLENRPMVERYIKFRLPNPTDAEDVLQEVCLAAFRQFGRLKSRESFKAWLIGIAGHKCADYFRRRSQLQEIPLDETPETELSSGRYGLLEENPVRETLASLNSRDRELLSLYYLDDLPQKEIGARLHIPVGTVKSRLYTAKGRFRRLYPGPLPGRSETAERKDDRMKSMPKTLPEYHIEPAKEPPFPVVWEELMGWFLVPKPGETLQWGMYDLPSRKLDTAYEMSVTGKASVHGIEGVEVAAHVTANSGEPIGDPGNPDNMRFVAQLTESHCRFLACARTVDGVKRYVTFLDGNAFLPNWGFGENNCGNETHLSPKGDLKREGDTVICAQKNFLLDVVGRYIVTIGGKAYDTVCVMDVETYDEGVVSEQFLDQHGRTVLWRRFNVDDWGFDRYHKTWSQLLPENQRLTVDGKTYVHWYDCITSYIL